MGYSLKKLGLTDFNHVTADLLDSFVDWDSVAIRYEPFRSLYLRNHLDCPREMYKVIRGSYHIMSVDEVLSYIKASVPIGTDSLDGLIEEAENSGHDYLVKKIKRVTGCK